jgi:hypothetical protein
MVVLLQVSEVRGDGMALIDKINAQYGEQPEQYRVTQEGNAYLDAQFPGLSSIVSMRLAEPETELQTDPEPELEPEQQR